MNPSSLRVVFRNSLVLQRERLLYIDRAFVVIDKPPGFITQYPVRSSEKAVEPVARLLDASSSSNALYPVHRLDKGTTGCLVFARSPTHAHSFSNQLRAQHVQKFYYALVEAENPPFGGSKTGSIRVLMALEDGRPYVTSDPSLLSTARDTLTDWELIGSSSQVPLSLVRLRLHTGMKHQLRVHMSEVLQAPILGDHQHSRMNGQASALLNDIQRERLFLHASEISFYRFKRSGRQKRMAITIRSPLPDDFIQLCIRAGVNLAPKTISGGLFVDGNSVQEIPELDGSWLRS